VSVGSSLLIVATPGVGLSAQNPCGTFGHYFDGAAYNTTLSPRFTGSDAVLKVRDPALCGSTGTSQNFTSGWTMLASRDGLGYVQTGFVKSAAAPLQHVGQFYDDPAVPVTKYGFDYGQGPLANGQFNRYWNNFNPSTGRQNLNIDGTQWMTTNFNPNGSWLPQPFQPQFFGEVTYKESDMPGTSTSPTTFTSMQGQTAPNYAIVPFGCDSFTGTFSSANPSLGGYNNNNPVRWGQSRPSCTSFNIWTSQ